MSEDVRLFLEQHSHPKAACMGHSMGGRSMMYFARKYVSISRGSMENSLKKAI